MGLTSLADFETAGQAVLVLLQRRFGFGLCMVTRADGEQWTVLRSVTSGFDIAPGKAFKWSDSFGSEIANSDRGVAGRGTVVVPAHQAGAPAVDFAAKHFVGEPLRRSDGTLFGTLCAVRSTAAIDEHELVELLAALLSKILQDELSATEEARRCERLEAECLTDPLTRLYNRRAWDRFLVSEETRCRRYGHPAALFSIDLDKLKIVNDAHGHAAGDALLARTAQALRTAVRSSDVVARLGGDEFGILGVGCDRTRGENLLAHVREALEDAGVDAATGFAMRSPFAGLNGAWECADQCMYQEKHARCHARAH